MLTNSFWLCVCLRVFVCVVICAVVSSSVCVFVYVFVYVCVGAVVCGCGSCLYDCTQLSVAKSLCCLYCFKRVDMLA